MIEWLAAEWPQVLGFSTGAVCVLLAARRNIWNYPIGILNNLVFVVLFVSAGIYASAGLQIVFLAFGLHGWWRWSRGLEQSRAYIGHTPTRAIPTLIVAGLAGAAVLWWVLVTFTDSQVAVADAATTAGSLVAQYMLNRKWIENWLVWIAIDVAFIGLSIATGLVVIAVLYGLFIVMCIYGFVSWRRIERTTLDRELVAVSGDARG